MFTTSPSNSTLLPLKSNRIKIGNEEQRVDSLARIAEKKIQEAMKTRDFTSSKWKNKPLPLENDTNIPADLKMAYKILKNSGYLPPEIEEKKEVQRLEELIATTEDEHERLRQMKKLNVLLLKIDAKRTTPANIAHQDDYYRKVVERISLAQKKK